MSLVIYVCEKCDPDWGDATVAIVGIPSWRICDVCTKQCDANYFTFRKYYRKDIFYANKCIKQLELNTALLEAKIKLLENHIKFAPGGEGALQALYSFTQHLQEPSLDAERPVGNHTNDK